MSQFPTNDFVASNRFEIRRQIGIGGMGVVYEAFDRQRNEVVALKTIRQITPESVYRLKREFRTLADITHPNLVRLYELFSSDDGNYFTMEFVAGIDFLSFVRGFSQLQRDHSTEGQATHSTDNSFEAIKGESGACTVPLTPDTTAHDAWQTVFFPIFSFDNLRSALRSLKEGIECLHLGNQLHRDIKPTNILVTSEGRVVLLDCGLALNADSDSNATGAVIAGTYPYMSPEQCAGARLGPASDWYSVGVILYEALVGERPFTGNVMEVVIAKQRSEPIRPSNRRPDIPYDLDELCMRLLERDPTLRANGDDIAKLCTTATGQLPPKEIRFTRTTKQHFVGRTSELEVLHTAFRDVATQQSVVVLINGESGLGKSTLVSHFLDDVRLTTEAVVLCGRCYERESLPFKSIDDLIDELAKYWMRLPVVRAAELLPRDIGILSRLFPTLQRIEAVANAPQRGLVPLDQKELRRRGFAGLKELLGRISDRAPLILFIDDLQWGDMDGISLLTDLLCPPDQPPLLLIVSYRDEAARDRGVVNSFLSSPQLSMNEVSVRRVDLTPLDDQASRQLALALTEDRTDSAISFAASVAKEAGGNPYFVDALARLWQTSEHKEALHLSSSVSLLEVIYTWISSLSEIERKIVEIIAVAGHPMSEINLTKCEIFHSSIRESLRRLCTERLLKTIGSGDCYEPFHDRIRQAVIACLDPARIADYQLLIAGVLEASESVDSATIAAHFAAAGQYSQARKYFELAAHAANKSLAFDLAAEHFQRVLELVSDPLERNLIREQQADALANAGSNATAADQYLTLASCNENPAAWEFKRKAAVNFFYGGSMEAGMSVLKDVVEAVGLKIPQTVPGAIFSLLYHRGLLSLGGLWYRPLEKRIVDSRQKRSSRQLDQLKSRVRVCRSAGHGMFLLDPLRAIDFFTQHLIYAFKLGDPAEIAVGLAWAAVGSAMGGEGQERKLLKLLYRAEEISASLNDPMVSANVLVAHGIASSVTGKYSGALSCIDKAVYRFQTDCVGAFYEQTLAEGTALWIANFCGYITELRRRGPVYYSEGKKREDAHRLSHIANMVLLPLADDQPDRAEAEVHLRSKALSKVIIGFHQFLAFYAQLQIHLYRSDAVAALEHDQRNFPLIASTVKHFQLARVLCNYGRCCAHLVAASSGERLHYHIGKCKLNLKKIERENTTIGRHLSHLLRAGLLSFSNPFTDLVRDEVSNNLRIAISGFQAQQMPIFTHCAARRLGQLLKNDEGQQWVSSAENWMDQQGIKNKDRITSLFVPGDLNRK